MAKKDEDKKDEVKKDEIKNPTPPNPSTESDYRFSVTLRDGSVIETNNPRYAGQLHSRGGKVTDRQY